MCGIIGIVSRPPTRPTPTDDQVLAGLDAALAARPDVSAVASEVAAVDALLKGLPGVLALADRIDLVASITNRLDRLDAFAAHVESNLDASTLAGAGSRDADEGADGLTADALERANAELIMLKDGLWSISRDRLRTAREVENLAGPGATPSCLSGYLVVQQAFSAIDRLEVRGRDSAGVHLYLWGHDISADTMATLLAERGHDPLFQSGSVEVSGDSLSFVYKTAA